MCLGGGSGGSSSTDEYAAQQRSEQERRERRVREGVDQLDALFEGGTRGVDPATTFNPDAVYYDASGDVIFQPGLPQAPAPTTQSLRGASLTPGGGRGGPNAGVNIHVGPGSGRGGPSNVNRSAPTAPNPDIAPAYSVDHSWMQDLVKDGLAFTGTGTAQGFDENFYNQRRDAYLSYANPEVDKQFGDALEEMTFALSRAGTLDSSIAADRFAKVEQQRGDARRRIADAADDQAARARSAVADERSRLTQLIHATGDPTASLAGVGDVLQSLRANPVYDPIGPVFQNVTAGIGNFAQGRRYADMERRLDDLFRTPNQGSARMVN